MDPDFFWLGRVPCRTVQFYGLVVGVQSYETRTVYSGESAVLLEQRIAHAHCVAVDDGSGVIDCNLRHSTQLQFGRKSPQKRTKPKSKQAAPATLPDAKDLAPKPIARLGDVVRVVGRVLNRHHTRLVNAEQFRKYNLVFITSTCSHTEPLSELCKDANVEPRHWLMVAELHESWYHAPDMAPFMIPQRKAAAMDASCSNATQESQDMHRAQTQSPSKSSVASSAPSSPSSVAESTSASSQYSPKVRMMSGKIRTYHLNAIFVSLRRDYATLVVCIRAISQQTRSEYTSSITWTTRHQNRYHRFRQILMIWMRLKNCSVERLKLLSDNGRHAFRGMIPLRGQMQATHVVYLHNQRHQELDLMHATTRTRRTKTSLVCADTHSLICVVFLSWRFSREE